MDFSKSLDTIAAAEKGFEYTFIDPIHDVETDVKISVVGIGSRAHKQAKAAFDQRMEQLKKACSPRPVPQDEEDSLLSELVAKCTTGWKNVADKGAVVEWSVDNAADMFYRYPVLRGAVTAALFDLKSMLGNV